MLDSVIPAKMTYCLPSAVLANAPRFAKAMGTSWLLKSRHSVNGRTDSRADTDERVSCHEKSDHEFGKYAFVAGTQEECIIKTPA
jgi:hypothetical protein